MNYTQQQFNCLSLSEQRNYILSVFEQIENSLSVEMLTELKFLLNIQDMSKSFWEWVYDRLQRIVNDRKVIKHNKNMNTYKNVKKLNEVLESKEGEEAEAFLSLLTE